MYNLVKIIALATLVSSILSYDLKGFLKAEPTTPCCQDCAAPTVKYYSIDKIFGHCGETCIKPSMFWIFKIFEPSLTKDDDSNTPCADRNYTFY